MITDDGTFVNVDLIRELMIDNFRNHTTANRFVLGLDDEGIERAVATFEQSEAFRQAVDAEVQRAIEMVNRSYH